MGEGGVPMQQDANECLTELLRVLQQKLKIFIATVQPAAPAASLMATPTSTTSQQRSVSLVEQYFNSEFVSQMKCEESPDEPAVTSRESFLQLSCFISQDVKYLYTGLKLRLEEK